VQQTKASAKGEDGIRRYRRSATKGVITYKRCVPDKEGRGREVISLYFKEWNRRCAYSVRLHLPAETGCFAGRDVILPFSEEDPSTEGVSLLSGEKTQLARLRWKEKSLILAKGF